MTDHKRQMELGRLTNTVRFAKERKDYHECELDDIRNGKIKANPSTIRSHDEYDKFYANVVDFLMDYGVDKYGPEFDNAVKD